MRPDLPDPRPHTPTSARSRTPARTPWTVRLWDVFQTGKPRVAFLFLVMAWTGSVLSSDRLWSARTPAMLVGLGLALTGAGALNQYLERHRDALMPRTRARALPQGRLSSGGVLAAGVCACCLGVAVLGALVNPLSAALASAGAGYYLAVYTIVFKPRTSRSAVIGGPAGVFPFLVGWAAGGGAFDMLSVYVSALVFLWSPAHFWAVTIARSEEYSAAGLPTPVSARGGRHAGSLVLLYAAATVAVSLLPVVGSDLGVVYLGVAVVAGAALGVAAVRVGRLPVQRNARLLYAVSGPYLTAILLGLVLDRVS